MKEENKLILDKFLFMREMYQETLSDKRQYKKQILGSRDSFGKIFDITKNWISFFRRSFLLKLCM